MALFIYQNILYSFKFVINQQSMHGSNNTNKGVIKYPMYSIANKTIYLRGKIILHYCTLTFFHCFLTWSSKRLKDDAMPIKIFLNYLKGIENTVELR